MTAITLTNLEAYRNMKAYEQYENLDKKQVYGFGVSGKKFCLKTYSDSLISRIWYSIKKFFGCVKSALNPKHAARIQTLKDATVAHISTADYQNWAIANKKATPDEIAALRIQLTAKEVAFNALSAKLARHDKRFGVLKKEKKALEEHVNNLSDKFAKLAPVHAAVEYAKEKETKLTKKLETFMERNRDVILAAATKWHEEETRLIESMTPKLAASPPTTPKGKNTTVAVNAIAAGAGIQEPAAA